MINGALRLCRDGKIDHYTQCHGQDEHLLARAKNEQRKELKMKKNNQKPPLTDTQSPTSAAPLTYLANAEKRGYNLPRSLCQPPVRTMPRFALLFVVGFGSLCPFAPVQAQNEAATVLSLDDAKTIADVRAYIQQEERKHDLRALDSKSAVAIRADIRMRAGNKMLELAEGREKWEGYNQKVYAFHYQMMAGVEGAEQEFELFLKHLAQHGEVEVGKATNDGFLRDGHFFLFYNKMMKADASPENFEQFKTELKMQIDRQFFRLTDIVALGFQIAEKNEVFAKQLAEEMVEYIRSPDCALSAIEKMSAVAAWERKLRLALGIDPKLYGRTLNDEEFNWESLRGKYVLIKFTATWCVPCRAEIPDMLEAYEKYHDRGFEIVSAYIYERGNEDEQIETVRQSVEKEKLPWIILSETQTEKAGQPLFRNSYFYQSVSVPTMVLVDQEGNIVMTRARGRALQTKLAEIFER